MSTLAAAATDEARWRAVLERDSRFDGAFFFGVVTTGVYCRPSCPARRPLRSNVRFFATPEEAERAGLRACLRCKPREEAGASTRSRMVERLCRYIEANTDRRITLEDLSKRAGISRFHLQRVFKAELGISPAKYLQASRFAQFKGALRKQPVTTAWAEAGYSSPSRIYETARARLGMVPSRYRSGAPEEQLRFTTFHSTLGKMLLVASNQGVCSVQFAEAADPVKSLRAEYPNANLSRDDKGLAQWAAQVSALVEGGAPSSAIPLDIRGTAFQQRVWQELRKIPAGQTRSYSQVARAIGKRSAVRAVASACASNGLAIVVPCHRVVHKDGSPKGYRWGTDRKKKLLEMETRG